MNIRDSASGYSWLSILLHWLTAITVITLYTLGEMAEDAGREERRRLIGLHISIAASMYLVLWARIGWRTAVRRPAPVPQGPVLDWLAHWVPIILLTAIAVMLVSGPLMVWSADRAISIFGLVDLASPLGEMETLHEAMESIHKASAKVVLAAFLLHLGGVLKHLLLDRDDTLKKMLVPGNQRSG